MKKRRKIGNSLNHGSNIITLLLIQAAIILIIIGIIFGGLFNFLGASPPKITEPIINQQTTEYETIPEIVEKETTVLSTPDPIQTESNVENTSGISTETTESSEIVEITETTYPNNEDVPIKPIGTVYLTFDDGPSTQITSQILDILKEKNVKATFFILDYSYGSEKEALVIREFDEGHTIALHGTSHDYSKIYTSLEALIENFTTLQEKVKTSTGYTATIIRFPGGSSNTVSKKYCKGIMTEAVNYFSNSEFIYFDWNIDSRDAGGVTSSQEVYDNVTSNLKPGKDNVVLMHDSSNKQFTLDALEAIIDFCIAEGYEFKAITNETPQVTHNVSN